MLYNDPPSLYPSTFIDSCYMNGICSIDEIRNSYLTLQAVPYYGLNKECVNVYGKPKKKLTIYDLDRIIFPFDPIKDWVEKEVKRIDEKYAWAEELSGRRVLEGRKVYE